MYNSVIFIYNQIILINFLLKFIFWKRNVYAIKSSFSEKKFKKFL